MTLDFGWVRNALVLCGDRGSKFLPFVYVLQYGPTASSCMNAHTRRGYGRRWEYVFGSIQLQLRKQGSIQLQL